MGCPEFALPSLKTLLSDPAFQVVSVYCMPDRPKGRGKQLGMTPIKEYALSRNLEVQTPASFRRDPEAVGHLRTYAPDFLVVVAYGLILPTNVLEIPRLAPVNLHASLLPKYRGPAPIHAALLHNDSETGNTVMLMSEKMDEGDMLTRQVTPITPEDTLPGLHDRLADLGAGLLAQTLKDFAASRVRPIPQDHSRATYTSKITPEMGKIDWGHSAGEILGLVRAMTPFPGASCEVAGERLKIGKAEAHPGTGRAPGTVLCAGCESGLEIECGSNSRLRILQIQRPGKTMMSTADFFRGYKTELTGIVLS
jgi:methionyl-tRNA formyltransferase